MPFSDSLPAYTKMLRIYVWLPALLTLALIYLPQNAALAFAYIFAGEGNGVDVVTHPIGYNGTGGPLTITVGIDPTSTFAADMVVPVQNVLPVMNALTPTTGNLLLGAANSIPLGRSILSRPCCMRWAIRWDWRM
ncbi:MAG: hypothetical protein D6722_24225 [Bacteroidetes bacterium]|nr:MAG: hypothetical protein D6722_24225 [Bacteroidota bacterium]